MQHISMDMYSPIIILNIFIQELKKELFFPGRGLGIIRPKIARYVWWWPAKKLLVLVDSTGGKIRKRASTIGGNKQRQTKDYPLWVLKKHQI